jgi:hypothetical protein
MPTNTLEGAMHGKRGFKAQRGEETQSSAGSKSNQKGLGSTYDKRKVLLWQIPKTVLEAVIRTKKERLRADKQSRRIL